MDQAASARQLEELESVAPRILRRDASASGPAPGAPWFHVRDIGLGEATGGDFAASIFTAAEAFTPPPAPHRHDAVFQLVYVLRGEIEFQFGEAERTRLYAGDAVFQPRGCLHCVTAVSNDLELLEITSPAVISTIQVP